jgi:hypothetical protein
VRKIQSTYSADARFLSGRDKEQNNLAEDAFAQRSAPEVVEERNRKRINSARAAGEYKRRKGYEEPEYRGRTPIGKLTIAGTELPSQRGRNYGRPGAGGMMRSKKPSSRFGRFYGF